MKLITENQVSELYGIRVATLRQWRFRGRGPVYYKTGRSVRYLAEDIENFIGACKRTSTSDPGGGGRR